MEDQTSPSRAYLDQLAAEGAYDSSGSFTVGEKAALEKLGAFQLPRKAAWVLKVVQSAVSGGATEIDIKQGRNRTSFAFALNELFDLDALEEALTSTSYAGPAYVQHLAVGLRAVGFGMWRSFELRSYQDSNLGIVRWDGDTLSRDYRPAKTKGVDCVVELLVDFSAKAPMLSMRSKEATKEVAEEGLELSRRASVCPIPLRLDGRRLDLLSSPERLQPAQPVEKIAQLCLAWSKSADDEEKSLRLPMGVELKEPLFSLGNRITDNRTFFLNGNKEDRASEFLLGMSYHYQVRWVMDAYQLGEPAKRASWLHGVWDGVVCDSTKLTGATSNVQADLYFSARGLPTDISGLTLAERSEELAERQQSALNFALSALDDLEEKLGDHSGKYAKLGGLFGAGILASFLAGPLVSTLAIMTGVIFSPAIVMGGIELARANRFLKLILADCRTNLRQLRQALQLRQ